MTERKVGSARRYLGARFAASVCVLVLATAGPAQTDSAGPSPFGRRFDGLRLLFAREQLEPGAFADLERGAAQDWMLVVLDDPQVLQRLSVRRFVERGGTLLVASDRPVRGLGEIGLSIAAGPLTAPPGPAAYRGVPACPVLTAWKSHPLFDSVRSLVMNEPGWLVGSALGSYAVAWAPPQTEISGDTLAVPPTLIAAGELGRGRFVVVADHSLFINEMLLELDNVVFARNAIRWLRRDRPPQRCRVVFREGSQEVTEWLDPRFVSGDWAPFSLEDVIALANELLVGLEDEDVFHRLLQGAQDRLRPTVRSLALLIPTGLLALLALVRWMAARRRPVVVMAASPTPLVADAVLEERQQAILRGGHFAEPAQALARNFFMQALQTACLPPTLPESVIVGGRWRRWWIHRRLLLLWQLAQALPPARVRRGRFSRLTRQVAQLNQAFGRREWWFRSDPESTRGRRGTSGEST